MAVTTRVTLVADTFTNITTQFEALGNAIKVLTDLTDVSVGIVKDGHTPTTLRAITGGVNGPAAVMSKPEGSTDDVWAYSTAGGNIYLHGAGDHVELVEKDVGTVSNALVGTGISSGGTAFVKESIVRNGDIITTKIIVDLIGLSSAAGVLDIIGESAAANCWFYQITTAKNGVVQQGTMECLVTPTTGDADIDLYSAVEATGTENAVVTDLTETLLVNGASMVRTDGADEFALVPAANEYLYFAGAGTTAAAYGAGRFLITMIGMVA
jgi:hypothetical protein